MERSCGTTHFALALSNFLCNKENQKTAYIELNATGQILNLSSENSPQPFCFQRIDLYPQITLETLPQILKKQYAYSVLDMGVLNEHTYREFLRCDQRFIVGSICPWKANCYYSLLESLSYQSIHHQKDFILLGNLGIKKYVKQFQQKYNICIRAVPFLENPFQLTPSDWTFLNELLKKN